MTEASHSKAEFCEDDAVTFREQDPDEVSGILAVRMDSDEQAEWESGWIEPPAMTCFTSVELYQRRRKLRRIVGMVITGAIMLLFLAGARIAARVQRARLLSPLTETSGRHPPARTVRAALQQVR
jgi:hypothetical protein